MDDMELSFPDREVEHARLDTEAPAPQPPLSDKETVGFYRAMQEERDKRQALEKQLAELKARDTPASASPSAAADPALEATVYANNLRVSRRFAEREYGREAVAAVHDWAAARCDADPRFNQRMRSSDDPYEAAKQAFDQEQALRTPTPQTPDPRPPRSLADAPGNGAAGKPHVPVGDGNAYGSIFR